MTVKIVKKKLVKKLYPTVSLKRSGRVTYLSVSLFGKEKKIRLSKKKKAHVKRF